MSRPAPQRPGSALRAALDDMELPLMRVEAVSALLAALETSDNLLEPHHVMPLGECLFKAWDALAKSYEAAQQAVRGGEE